ncbi:MAG: hypothetical protein K1Y02_14845 [Candidatus Hydrogenedentes bacterium]|nr:hypothetical protein [Candidatus Hydrogenedentota bacterium]
MPINLKDRGRLLGNEKGMALVEVVFALVVLTATLSLLVGSLISLNRLASVTEQRERAAVRMSSYMDSLRHAAPGEIVAGTFQSVVAPESGESWQVQCQSVDGNYHSVPVDTATLTSPLTVPLTVRVTLTRKDARGVPVQLTTGAICQQ